MPNHGITALVDFIEPFEAKKAFNKLAYSQFKAAPLYLEWAPENVFVKSIDNKEIEAKQEKESSKEKVSKTEITTKTDKVSKAEKSEVEKTEEKAAEEKIEEETEMPENDSTIFVKNLNFKTTENNLKEVLKILFYKNF